MTPRRRRRDVVASIADEVNPNPRTNPSQNCEAVPRRARI
jgi:hypothetical protein